MDLDEAQTRLGREGIRHAFEHDGVVPDVLTLSKTSSSSPPTVIDVITRDHLVQRATATSVAGALGAWVTQRCLELGRHLDIVQLPGISDVLRIAPALTSSEAEIDLGVELLGAALDSLVR